MAEPARFCYRLGGLHASRPQDVANLALPMRAQIEHEIDELTARSALWSLWSAALLIALPAAARPESAAYYLSLSAVLVVAAATLTTIRAHVSAHTVARAALLTAVVLGGFGTIVTGGTQSPAFQSYAVVVVGGTWLVLEPVASSVAVALLVGAGALLAGLESAAVLPDPWVTHTAWSRWLTTSVACLIVAVVQRLEVNRLRGAYGIARLELDRSHEAERRAATSEQRHAEVVSTVPGVVFEFEIRPDGTRAFTFVSDGVRLIFGVSPDEALRDPDRLFDLVAPDDQRPVLHASIARSAATLTPWELAGTIRTACGASRWIRGQAVPTQLPGGAVRWRGVITDITARVEAERALQDSQAALKHSVSLLQAALESTADGILIVDTAGRVTGYNQKFLSLWRVPQDVADTRDNERLLDHVMDQLVEPDVFLARVRKMNAQPDAVTFDTIAFKDGRRFERYSQPQVVDGVTVGRVASFRDVTSRVAQEQRRSELEQQLQHAQKLEALGTLAGGIAHDFNNLLTVVIGQAELARRQPDEDLRLQSLDEISEAGVRASALVRRIREFSQPQPPERTVVAVAPTVENTVQLLRSTLPKSIELTADLCPNVTMFANATELQQVVTNLVVNAGQAIGDAAGRIDVTLDEVGAAGLPPTTPGPFSDRYARLTVTDTGRGMTPDVLPRIFEPFFTTKADRPGSGLGLSIVHGIVRRHRGAVTVESVPGQGATFRVFWPALPPTTRAPDAGRVPSIAAPESGKGRHIMVVDDEAGVIRVVVDSLERIGYQVTPFTDPREALQRFQAAPGDFDAVLTDLSMPHISGLELGRRLLDAKPGVPVVLFTGYNADLGPEEVRAIGFCAIIAKPMTPAALAEVLHRALDDEKKGPR